MKAFVCTRMLLFVSVTAYAADVDGKWTGTVDGLQGPTPVTFDFKSDGTKLTGTTASPDLGEVQIKDGKIDGNNIAFTVTFDFGGMPFMLSYKGVVSPDQIKMSADVFGMPIEFVVKKAKTAVSVDGTWTGTVAAPTGDVPVSFAFKADGAKLTGSTTAPDGTTIQIKDGKIDGSNIAFNITLDFAGMPFTMPYKGVVTSDQIKMSAEILGMPLEFVVKKSK